MLLRLYPYLEMYTNARNYGYGRIEAFIFILEFRSNIKREQVGVLEGVEKQLRKNRNDSMAS